MAARFRMTIAKLVLSAILAVVLATTVLAAPAAVDPAPTEVPLSVRLTDWNKVLDLARRYVGNGKSHTGERSEEQLGRIAAVRLEAAKAKDAVLHEIEATQPLMDALGPVPAADQPPETKEIVAKRRQYADLLAAHKAYAAQAEIVLTRARTLEVDLSRLRRDILVDSLMRRNLLPLSGTAIAKAATDMVAVVATLSAAPSAWYDGLSPESRDDLRLTRLFLSMAAGWGAALLLGRWLLRRFGYCPVESPPPYHRRLMAAVAEGATRGLVPAALLGAALAWVGINVTGPFADLLEGVLGATLVLVLVAGLTRAALAPHLPDWRLTDLKPGHALLIARRVLLLAGVFAADLAFRHATANLAPSAELDALARLAFASAEAVGILLLAHGRLWLHEPAPERHRSQFWTLARHGVAVAAVAGVAAAVAGYTELAAYILHNLIASGAVAGGLALVRGLLHELIAVPTQSKLLREKLGIELGTLETADFWLRAALEPLLILVGVLVLAPLWGVPRDDLLRWAGLALTGFPVGSMTVSLLDIAIAVGVFLASSVATRMVQRRLQEGFLPATRLDVSTQHSLVAAVGYLGVVVGAALSIAVVGVDLTNLAMVAGALSVGIGFGLQNIVNNFVSGLIILVERPIRVGDWVVMGSSEGVVRRISIRATELETWERAAVVIPNAEILSGRLMNWTLKDKLGRIDVKVGVAYGSNLDKVSEILLDIARGHGSVLPLPEPFVMLQNFGDSSLDLELRCYTSDVLTRARTASDMRFEIERRFRTEHIAIPSPHRTVHIVGAPAALPVDGA